MKGELTGEAVVKGADGALLEASTGIVAAPPNAIKGLLWCEWFAHSKLLLSFLATWLLCVWVLPIFAHPGWILLFGLIYALMAGPAYGGGDVIEGCEEFSFSLPATRAERYGARLVVGGGSLLLFTAMDFLALGFDLPQILAKLYVDTGIIKPFPVFKPRLLYGLVFAFPFAVFAFSFALSAAAHSRMLIFTSWFWSLLGALGVLQIGLFYEGLVSDAVNGYFSCPLLVAAGVASLWGGFFRYARKEAGAHSAPVTIPARWWMWAILMVLGILLALALVSSLMKQYPQFLAATDPGITASVR